MSLDKLESFILLNMDFKWLALLSFVVNVEQLEFPTFLFCKHRKFSLPILQAWGQVHREDVKKDVV